VCRRVCLKGKRLRLRVSQSHRLRARRLVWQIFVRSTDETSAFTALYENRSDSREPQVSEVTSVFFLSCHAHKPASSLRAINWTSHLAYVIVRSNRLIPIEVLCEDVLTPDSREFGLSVAVCTKSDDFGAADLAVPRLFMMSPIGDSVQIVPRKKSMRKLQWLALLICVLVSSATSGCGAKPPDKVTTTATTDKPKQTSAAAAAVKPGETGEKSPESKTKPAPTSITTTTINATSGEAPAGTGISAEIQKQVQAFAAKQKEKAGAGDLGKRDLQKIGLGFHNFLDTYRNFPALNGPGSEGAKNPGLSWRVYLLPYIDGAHIFQKFKLDEPWDSEHNKPLIKQMPVEYGRNAEGKTRLHVFTGKGAPFQNDIGPSMRDFTDGSSNTLLFALGGEDTAEIWTKPGGLEFDPQQPLKCLGKIGESFWACLADGRVVSLPATIEPTQFAALVQNADGIPIAAGTIPAHIPASANSATQAAIAKPVTPLGPTSPTLNLSLIPADAFVAIVLHPRRIFEHPVVAEFHQYFPPATTNYSKLASEQDLGPVSELLHIGPPILKFGIAPQYVDEIVLMLDRTWPESFATSRGEVVPPVIGVILRNSAPLSVDTILKTMWEQEQDLELREFEGVSLVYYPRTSFDCGLIDDKTFIYGTESFVHKMIAARSTTAPSSALTKRLHAVGNRLAVMAIDGVAIEKGVKALLREAPPIVAPFAAFIAGAQEFALSIDLDAPELLQADLQFKTPELAQGLFGMADQFYTGAKEQQAPLIRQQMAAQNPVPTQLLAYFDQLVAETKFVNSGNAISLTVPKLKDLDKLADAMKPAFEMASHAAKRTERINNLRQIGLAFMNYASSTHEFPALNGPSDKNLPHPGLSWRVYLLPFLGHADLLQQFNLKEPWDSAHNKPLIQKMPKIFGEDKEGKTSIHVFTGPGAPFQPDAGLNLEQIVAYGQTILAIEAGDDVADIWTKPGGLVFDPEDPLKCLGKIKEFSIILMDGAVQQMKDVDAETFKKMVQYRGGQRVQKP
jgi:hypothetical protein